MEGGNSPHHPSYISYPEILFGHAYDIYIKTYKMEDGNIIHLTSHILHHYLEILFGLEYTICITLIFRMAKAASQ